jgi:hypothetical protein
VRGLESRRMRKQIKYGEEKEMEIKANTEDGFLLGYP